MTSPAGKLASSAAEAATAVLVRDVDMDFGSGSLAVKNANFALETGRFLTILGPSGSGKTTLLRMIAGFQKPTFGTILIGGKPSDAVAPHRRSIGMVFQKLALFPHMSVAENVAFPLKMRRHNPKTIPAKVADYLDLVRLGGFGTRRINELSGGQQQRVAIARALVFEPELLLLDEPLAALDRKLREEMQLEFRRIQKELGVTTINVTHDQREALVVSDEIIVMDQGRIEQHATPAEMYRKPASPFVANFIGVTSFLSGENHGEGMRRGDSLIRGTATEALPVGAPVQGAIRAEQIRLSRSPLGLENRFEGQITDRVFEGERVLYFAHIPALQADLQIYHHDPSTAEAFDIGSMVHIGWNASDLLIFPETNR